MTYKRDCNKTLTATTTLALVHSSSILVKHQNDLVIIQSGGICVLSTVIYSYHFNKLSLKEM